MKETYSLFRFVSLLRAELVPSKKDKTVTFIIADEMYLNYITLN
jgi:hypothetical protein